MNVDLGEVNLSFVFVHEMGYQTHSFRNIEPPWLRGYNTSQILNSSSSNLIGGVWTNQKIEYEFEIGAVF